MAYANREGSVGPVKPHSLAIVTTVRTNSIWNLGIFKHRAGDLTQMDSCTWALEGSLTTPPRYHMAYANREGSVGPVKPHSLAIVTTVRTHSIWNLGIFKHRAGDLSQMDSCTWAFKGSLTTPSRYHITIHL